MKKTLLFILLFSLSTLSAQHDLWTQTLADSTIVSDTTQNMSELKNEFLEMKKFAAEKCKKDSLRATEEAKYNLSYSLILSTPMTGNDFFVAEKEFIQLLRENKIGFGGYIVGNCFGIPDGCFQREMNRIVEQKFGKKFLDTLETAAVKAFVANNPDYIFEDEECDMESRYLTAATYDEMLDKTEADYFKSFKYPEGFIKKNADNRYSNVEANFILDRKGKPSAIRVELSLKEKKNYIYSAYLINSVKEFISKSKWKPATYKGVPVISKMNILIFYK